MADEKEAEIGEADLKARQEQLRKDRAVKASAEIDQVLQKYNCILIAEPITLPSKAVFGRWELGAVAKVHAKE